MMPIPVLLYHSVSDAAGPDRAWGAVSRSQFESHVEVLCACNRTAITISALAEGLRGRCPLPARPVAITFDDGFEDTRDAVALLSSCDVVCTVYVTTGEIGGDGRLSPGQLRELGRMPGVELGAHAVRHRRLDELAQRELLAEVSVCKSQLEGLLGQRVSSFAYPHGAYDTRVRQAVITTGYRSAAAVKNANCHSGDDPFAIARWTVTGATSPQRLAEVLQGKGVPLAWSGERLRTRVHRIARRQRRRLVAARNGSW